MRLGVHVIRRHALKQLAAREVHVPEPWIGIVDYLRMLEGHSAEPPSQQALGVVGLDTLLEAVGGDADDVLRLIRGRTYEALRYFERSGISLCILVEAAVEGRE